MVQRVRLRSMSDPPVLPPATPTPNAPDMPASLPECSRMSRIRITLMKTCTTERTVYIGRSGYYGRYGRLVEAVQQVHRLAPQLAVERAPVGLGELAGAEVH